MPTVNEAVDQRLRGLKETHRQGRNYRAGLCRSSPVSSLCGSRICGHRLRHRREEVTDLEAGRSYIFRIPAEEIQSARERGSGRADLPRDPFLPDPSADPLGTALSPGPFGASQLGQSLAVVVAVDASDRAIALFLVGAVASDDSVEPDSSRSTSFTIPASAPSSAISVSTRSSSARPRVSTATPMLTISTTSILK